MNISSSKDYPISLEIIYQEYKEKVYRYFIKKIKNDYLAEELTSEVFFKVVKGLHTYCSLKSSVSTWIYTISHNVYVDYLKKLGKRDIHMDELIERSCSHDTVDEMILCQEKLEHLALCLKRLAERERELIILRFYYGVALQEASEKIGVSYKNATVIQTRALKKLKKMLEEYI